MTCLRSEQQRLGLGLLFGSLASGGEPARKSRSLSTGLLPIALGLAVCRS